jgi:hypothetical protein
MHGDHAGEEEDLVLECRFVDTGATAGCGSDDGLDRDVEPTLSCPPLARILRHRQSSISPTGPTKTPQLAPLDCHSINQPDQSAFTLATRDSFDSQLDRCCFSPIKRSPTVWPQRLLRCLTAGAAVSDACDAVRHVDRYTLGQTLPSLAAPLAAPTV